MTKPIDGEQTTNTNLLSELQGSQTRSVQLTVCYVHAPKQRELETDTKDVQIKRAYVPSTPSPRFWFLYGWERPAGKEIQPETEDDGRGHASRAYRQPSTTYLARP